MSVGEHQVVFQNIMFQPLGTCSYICHDICGGDIETATCIKTVVWVRKGMLSVKSFRYNTYFFLKFVKCLEDHKTATKFK